MSTEDAVALTGAQVRHLALVTRTATTLPPPGVILITDEEALPFVCGSKTRE
jgi:hypothetical protein